MGEKRGGRTRFLDGPSYYVALRVLLQQDQELVVAEGSRMQDW